MKISILTVPLLLANCSIFEDDSTLIPKSTRIGYIDSQGKFIDATDIQSIENADILKYRDKLSFTNFDYTIRVSTKKTNSTNVPFFTTEMSARNSNNSELCPNLQHIFVKFYRIGEEDGKYIFQTRKSDQSGASVFLSSNCSQQFADTSIIIFGMMGANFNLYFHNTAI